MRRNLHLQLLLSVLTASIGQAQVTRHVPAQFPTIEAAIDASADGDEVVVAPGTYDAPSGGISFQGKAVTVRSSGGFGMTTVRWNFPFRERCFRFEEGEGPDSVLEGFTLSGFAQGNGGTGRNGGAIRVLDASPVIRECLFFLCETAAGAQGSDGGPLFGPSPGETGGDGGAIYLEDSDARIEGCWFLDCQVGDGGSGGVGSDGASGTPGSPNGAPAQNGARGGRGGRGGGIFIGGVSSPVIVNCLFEDNRSGAGGTGGLGGGGGSGFYNGLFYTGVGGSGGDGGAGGDAGEGGAIYAEASADALVINCTLFRNESARGGPGGNPGSGGIGASIGASGSMGSDGEVSEVGGVWAGIDTAVRNSIFYLNQVKDAEGPTVTYSAIVGYPGVGNHSQDPGFEPQSFFRLADGSPCIDAGDPAGSVLAVDYEGQPRAFDHPLIAVPGAGIVDMGMTEFVDSFAVRYGCGLNPSGSLTLVSGDAEPGQTLVFSIDNPFGNQGAGALPYLIFSVPPPPAGPCGFLVSGLGMAGNGTPGAVQIDLNNAEAIAGAPWNGVGLPEINAPLPNLASLVGVHVHVQGLLLGGGSNQVGLSDAIQLVVGPEAP